MDDIFNRLNIAKKWLQNRYSPEECRECEECYIGETGRRLQERVTDHAGRDKNSNLYRHSIEQCHPKITLDDFIILGEGYKSTYKRKVSEALFIKRLKPRLNTQGKSVPITLFN